MRVVLADVRSHDGFVHKDTVVGGYGSRMRGTSMATRAVAAVKRRLTDVPSITMAYLAAILDRAGHEVRFTRGEQVDGDLTLVLSSLVDYRNETRWADAARRRGMQVGFVGLAASKLPELFEPHADFVVYGEPDEAVVRLANGDPLAGAVNSGEMTDLDALPFPRWDLVGAVRRRTSPDVFTRPIGGLPLLASRSCPEHCTYCPHRILARYRTRSVASVVDELAYDCRLVDRPFVIFRDPLFTQDRERVLSVCEAIRRRGLRLEFECETRLDRLDEELLTEMRAAGLRSIQFGVESISPDILRRVGRRPIPEAQQREVIRVCNRLGVRTVGFYVLGFNFDTRETIDATIEYSIALGSTLAQYKVLTPYPGTPLFKHMSAQIFETDWERFDGYTVTFHHPNLRARELQLLLDSAYARFYLRPGFFARLSRVDRWRGSAMVRRLDAAVARLHDRRERAAFARLVEC